MKFIVWMNIGNYRPAQIAQNLAVPIGRVFKLLNGATPLLEEALLIQDLSGGKVTLDDFLQQQREGN